MPTLYNKKSIFDMNSTGSNHSDNNHPATNPAGPIGSNLEHQALLNQLTQKLSMQENHPKPNPYLKRSFKEQQNLIESYKSAIILQQNNLLHQINQRRTHFLQEIEYKFKQMQCNVESIAAKQLAKAFNIQEYFQRSVLYDHKYTIENYRMVFHHNLKALRCG